MNKKPLGLDYKLKKSEIVQENGRRKGQHNKIKKSDTHEQTPILTEFKHSETTHTPTKDSKREYLKGFLHIHST